VRIARAGDERSMLDAVSRFATGQIDRADLRRETSRVEQKKAGRPKNYTFNFRDKALPFSLSLTFKRPRVEKTEVVQALREVADRLEEEA
jgi:hypothetical protein